MQTTNHKQKVARLANMAKARINRKTRYVYYKDALTIDTIQTCDSTFCCVGWYYLGKKFIA